MSQSVQSGAVIGPPVPRRSLGDGGRLSPLNSSAVGDLRWAFGAPAGLHSVATVGPAALLGMRARG
jgi:hypothetical protein